MRIKLYTNVYEDSQEINLKYIELTIKGRFVHHVVYPKDADEEFEGVYENSLRKFSYHNDNIYSHIFPDLKLNTKIEIFHSSIHDHEDSNGAFYYDDAFIAGKEGYCHLSLWQRLILNFRFKKLWLQKEENLKRIITSTVAIVVAVATIAQRYF